MPGAAHHRPLRSRHLNPLASEAGFSVIESTVALGVVFAVVLGLMASLTTGIRGVLTGRQRSVAVAVGKAVIEEARAASFRDLGHDVNGDATLATDAALGGAAPNYTYTPLNGNGAEDLVAAVNPQFPTHQWSEVRDKVTYEITVYVTWVRLNTGDDYKRLTVFVSYDPAQYDTAAISNVVGLSTFVSVGGQSPIQYLTIPKQAPPGASTTTSLATTTTACPGCPAPDPYVEAQADGGGGEAVVTGTISGLDLTQASLLFPLSRGDVAGRLTREGHGVAQGLWAQVELGSGTPVGGVVDGSTAVCSPARATTVADNDSTLPGAVQDIDPDSGGYSTSSSCQVRTPLGSLNSIVVDPGLGKARSQTSVDSCLVCSPAVGDGDHLMYGYDEAAGDSAGSLSFVAGILSGLLVDSARFPVETTLDHDAGPLVASTAELSGSSLDIATLNLGPVGYVGAVRVPAASVTATAQAGPSAAAPAIAGDPVTIQAWSGVGGLLGLGGYVDVVVVPGQASETVVGDTFTVSDGGVGASVTIETTIRSGQATTSCNGGTPPCASPVTHAEASLRSWLEITVHLVAVQSGTTVADLTIDVDFGDVSAVAEYQP